ncbi:MAG: hypothetical protein ACKVP7_03040 [Hyphomicrobiaceae bacterium]
MNKVLKLAVAGFAGLSLLAGPAYAKCTRLAFSVNDYGKEGPTKDAKDLLDKYIASEMAKKGIKTYRVGKKDVTCELFLDVLLFDEHTCKAAATVCWGDGPAAKPTEASAPAAAGAPKETAAAPAKAATPAKAAAPAKPKPKLKDAAAKSE